MNDIRELNDAELEAVSGGMKCEDARVIASVYKMTSLALSLLGDEKGANYFIGASDGIQTGAGCW
jgi:hypothetical protein